MEASSKLQYIALGLCPGALPCPSSHQFHWDSVPGIRMSTIQGQQGFFGPVDGKCLQWNKRGAEDRRTTIFAYLRSIFDRYPTLSTIDGLMDIYKGIPFGNHSTKGEWLVLLVEYGVARQTSQTRTTTLTYLSPISITYPALSTTANHIQAVPCGNGSAKGGW